MLDYKEKLNTIFTSDQLDSRIEKKLSEYSQLITKETAIFLIAKENGIILEQSADSQNARQTKGRFSITGTISRIFPLREYGGGSGNGPDKKPETQDQGPKTRPSKPEVLEVPAPQGSANPKPKTSNQRLWLHDEKGDFTLVLWNSDTGLTKGKIGLGDQIKIIGATYRNGEINLGYGGKIERTGGIPTTPLSKLPALSQDTCNVEGEISEIYPEFFYKRASGEEAVMRSFDLTEGNTTVNVSVWHEPEQMNNFKFKDRVRIENAKYKKSSLQLNSGSRLVLLERKDEDGKIRGILEDAKADDGKLIAKLSGKLHSLSPEASLALLGVSPLPADISLSTVLELKKKEILGAEVVIRI